MLLHSFDPISTGGLSDCSRHTFNVSHASLEGLSKSAAGSCSWRSSRALLCGAHLNTDFGKLQIFFFANQNIFFTFLTVYACAGAGCTLGCCAEKMAMLSCNVVDDTELTMRSFAFDCVGCILPCAESAGGFPCLGLEPASKRLVLLSPMPTTTINDEAAVTFLQLRHMGCPACVMIRDKVHDSPLRSGDGQPTAKHLNSLD